MRVTTKAFLNKIVSSLLLLLLAASQSSAALADGLYDRVLKSGKLRAGYLIYFPLLMRDPNTKKFSGIGYDALLLAATKLGLQLEMKEEVSWGTMIEGLKTNRYDIIACPVWANASRARVGDFSRPLCYSVVNAYVKTGDKRLDSSLKDLNNPKFKIATLDGEMAVMIANADYPLAKKFSLPQMSSPSDLLLSVSSGKADITFAEPSMVWSFAKHNKNAVQNITPSKPLRIFPNVFMFNSGEEKFKAMFNATLDEVDSGGDLDKIIDKYEPFAGCYLRVAKPYRK